MKKVLSLLLCMVCILGTFVGCEKIEIVPKSTLSDTKVEKFLTYQEDIENVFKIEKCVLDANELGFTMQLLNETDKTIVTFSLLLQYFDNKNNIVKEDVRHDDYPYQTKPGELTHDVGYNLKSNLKCVKVHVANIYYQDGSRWINKDLALSDASQLIVKKEKEVAGVYSVEQCKMDITKLELQIKNLSDSKTIQSFSVLVRYLDILDQEENSNNVLDYDGGKIKPKEFSEKEVWSVFPGQYKTANCYVPKIVYTDGTQWDNPNIPVIEK